MFKWGIFPLFYIILLYLTVSRVPVLNRVLRFLGVHSANIFWVHMLYRSRYLKAFLYTRGHFLVIAGTLLAVSLLTSFLLEGLKKLIRYDRFTAMLEDLGSSRGGG